MSNQHTPKICPICKQGKKFKFIRECIKGKDKFFLYECSMCQVQFWLPFKIPGVEWHEEIAFRVKNIVKPEICRGYHKKFLQMHKNFPSGTKILDLGCAGGEFIAELEKRGCETWGVDFDKENIRVAREYFNLKNVFTMSFDEFFQKKDLPKFDIICLFAIIGYLDNPLEFIKKVKNLLKLEGIIVVNAPSRDRMLPNLNHWDFPPHYFTRWNEEAFSNLFKKRNFKISNIVYTDEFKTLQEAMTSKFRTGLVAKALAVSKNNKKSIIFAKTAYFLGRFKNFIIGAVPAGILWVIGKVFRYNNGEMLIELKHE